MKEVNNLSGCYVAQMVTGNYISLYNFYH
jgi:hypothetical protein